MYILFTLYNSYNANGVFIKLSDKSTDAGDHNTVFN